MRLYSGTSKQFIQDNIQNQIAEKLKSEFFDYFRYYPSDNEVRSWQNSLKAVAMVFQNASLLDHGVILEYQLPLTSKRLDCLVTGRDKARKDNAVIIELKQWEKCGESYSDNEVSTWVAGGNKDVLHPSVQVNQYRMYLADTHTAFNDEKNPINLNACSYLHNYRFTDKDVVLAPKFDTVRKFCPIFSTDDVDPLSQYLDGHLANGHGEEVLKRVEESKYRPSKKLMEHVSNTIKGNSKFILLDEQLVVYDQVFTWAKKGFHDKRKTVIIVRGGPGTGKSVIAINLMADLMGQGYTAHYATGSRAFTETLRKIIGSRGGSQFTYFNSYGTAESNTIDVLIADEAHRIRETSNSRFTPRANRSKKPQIEELLHAAKVCVFLLDDDQVVRPNEIGSSRLILDVAEKHKCNIFEHELEAQFRCNGSDAFVNWVNNTLGIKRTANVLWGAEEDFDFKIYNSPDGLDKAIRKKAGEGFTARMTAGFCWPWSMPNQDGSLQNDIIIGDYMRPWNAKPEARHLQRGIPKSNLWAHDPNGIDQVGCIYTAQGFEYDYAGVIFGTDLVYDPASASWEGHPESSFDGVVKRSGDLYLDLVKNTYRVLLSRGMKGCYVYFQDENTRNFFMSRMENPQKLLVSS